MPIYSLIALTLSLFGSTYTVIAALRSHFDKYILIANDSIKGNLDGVKGAGEHSDTWENAQRHSDSIKKWTFVWRWSHYIPIFAFWFFTFLISFLCIYDWGDITTKVGDGQSGTQEAIQSSLDGFTFITSFCGRGMLSFVLAVNLICSILAAFSGWMVKSSGTSLGELYKCAVESSAKDQIKPAK